ncbi:MAG: polyprenyl synthetase family protein [Clostridiales bacterium]|nr:polyprenyl synthetase family protein [Clostridiales bacterium]
MDFLHTHNQLKTEVEMRLARVFDDVKAPANIIKAMSYSLYLDGKRLRPVIMLHMARKLGVRDSVIFPLCCALEMIHTYSLIHDDLPAMDNDDIRRGKASNHKVFGEDMAILAGDGLLNFAYEIMIQNCPIESSEKYIRAVSYIISCAGVSGMIGGQVLDIKNESGTIEDLEKMHQLKTGKLFSASIMTSVMLSDLGDEEYSNYEEFCKNLGLLFQITDDILDVTGDEKIMGKTLFKDNNSGKVTYVSVYGLENALIRADDVKELCIQNLETVGQSDGYLSSLVEHIRQRNR